MTWPPIVKPKDRAGLAPNLLDYDEACRTFSWQRAREWLDGLPGGRGLNIAHEAVDRHVATGHGQHVAFRFLARRGVPRALTYGDLRRETNRFANVLQQLGLAKGDVVSVLAGRIPELYIAALGTLKHRCVFNPLSPVFGPDPILARMTIARSKVLVTTASLYTRRIAGLRASLPGLQHVLLADDGSAAAGIPGTLDLHALMAAASGEFHIPPTEPEDAALLHFTSGTTGRPKGAVHAHEAVVAQHATGRLALDLHPHDVFGCTADPGWVIGTSYGMIAPLTNGVTSIVDEGDFDVERWYQIIRDHRVSVWSTAPTAIRMLMKAGAEVARRRPMPSLRFLASVGGPLNPDAVAWGVEAFGLPFHDSWWQTETGGIMVANFASMDIRPGSMGRPLPGVEISIVRRAGNGSIAPVGAGEQGELAVRAGWPSMFRGYLGDPGRYRKCFAGRWYLTGDLARRDDDGYYWFAGRADDVIKASGHLIGPFEVESVLMEHPAVAEAGVIGEPDPVSMEVVKAFVALKPGFAPGDDLRLELMAHARTRLGPAVAPREIDFTPSLPKTRSGKIMRGC